MRASFFKGMLRMALILIVTAAMITSNCLATQRHEYKAGEVLEVFISGKEQNRLEFAGHNISEVIGDAGKYQLISDRQGGSIFITPRVPANSSFTVSVITDSGLVQDIRMTAANIAGSVVTIEKTDQKTEVTQKQEVAAMLRAMSRSSKGKYYVNKAKWKIPSVLPELTGLDLIRRQTYRYGHLTGVVMMIKNKSRKLVILEESSISRIFAGTLAVSMDEDILPSGASARVLIVTREKEER